MTTHGEHKPDKVRRIIADAAMEDASGGVVTAPAEALKALAEPRAKDREARLKRTLELVERVGKKELSDLLYEMARACLAADTAYSYAEDNRFVVQPKSIIPLVEEATALAARIMEDRLQWSELPPSEPPPDHALVAAEKCVVAAELVAGPGVGTRYLRAVIGIHRGDSEPALVALEGLLAERHVGSWLKHVHARRVQILNRLDRYDEALDAASVGTAEYPDDRLIRVNAAYAAASLKDSSTLRELLEATASTQSTPDDVAWWNGFVQRSAARISLDSGLPTKLIEEALLVPDRGDK